jgi:hypothetical protein
LLISGFPYLTVSALALSHRSSGLRTLQPFEFISPQNTPGVFPSELSPVKDWFVLDARFCRVSESFRLLSLAATRSVFVLVVLTRF